MPYLPARGALLADEFVISAGCILLKPLARDPSLITPRLPEDYNLVYIRKRKNDEKVIAKGRKDLGEAIQETAVRETYEETGYKSTIIELPTPSLQPPLNKHPAMNKEAIAVTLKIDRLSRPDRRASQKFVFWWVSEVDLDDQGVPVQRVEGTQMENEDYDVCEVSLDESLTPGFLTFEDDRKLVEMAKNLLIKRHEMSLVQE